MSIHSILKKEGIESIKPIELPAVKAIAKSVSDKICLAFPEHSLNKEDLFLKLSRMKMYTASMHASLSGAKYFYKENSIYFNEKLDFKKLDKIAVHECIHAIQEILDNNRNLSRLGLCTSPLGKATGKALNEASVQLMSSISNYVKHDSVKYYDITIATISPNYYPLECALLEQIAYFIGTYPLFHSTLYSNDVFKNTVIAKTDLDTYNTIENKLDYLLKLEDELYFLINELQYSNGNVNKIRRLNKEIACGKKLIADSFFETQNYIIDVFFTSEFNNVKNLENVTAFKEKLYNFKNLIGYDDNYTYYNNFYCDMMVSLEKKIDFIKENGSIDLIGSLKPELALIPAFKFGMSFFKRLLLRLGILVRKQY